MRVSDTTSRFRPGRQLAPIVALLVINFSVEIARCASPEDELEARRSQVARMQPSEQQELLRKQERFAALPAAEQDRLRALQAALDADPDAKRLHEVLVRYHEWLKTLTPSQRAKMAELPPQERVDEIKRLQQQQQAARERTHRADLLSWRDMREVLRWTEDFVWSRREDLMKEMSKEQRQRFEKWDRQRQRRTLLFKAFERSRRERTGGLAALEQPDVDRLADKLSEPAKQALAAAGTLPAQRKIVGAWIGTAMHRLEPWGPMRKQNPLVVEDLLQFLQNEVAPTERERLLKIPREEMLEELRAMYFDRGRRELGPPGGPGAPWFEDNAPDRPKGSFRGKGPRGQGVPRPPVPGESQAPDKPEGKRESGDPPPREDKPVPQP